MNIFHVVGQLGFPRKSLPTNLALDFLNVAMLVPIMPHHAVMRTKGSVAIWTCASCSHGSCEHKMKTFTFSIESPSVNIARSKPTRTKNIGTTSKEIKQKIVPSRYLYSVVPRIFQSCRDKNI